MCRFFSQPMYEHPTVRALEYYMRLDVDSFFLNVLPYDPFQYLHQRCAPSECDIVCLSGRYFCVCAHAHAYANAYACACMCAQQTPACVYSLAALNQFVHTRFVCIAHKTLSHMVHPMPQLVTQTHTRVLHTHILSIRISTHQYTYVHACTS
jgi:hypothetical protein